MKAFEEWVAKKELGIYIRDPSDRRHTKRKYREVWRAALEWALEHREMGHTVNLRRVIPTEVIKQELED